MENINGRFKKRIWANTSLAAMSLTPEDHAGSVIVHNKATACTYTLPRSTGSGCVYRIIVGTTVTGNLIVNVYDTVNEDMYGNAIIAQDSADTAVMFESGGTAVTITLNGSTTGGIAGAEIELIDIAANKWFAKVITSATGTEATPFS